MYNYLSLIQSSFQFATILHIIPIKEKQKKWKQQSKQIKFLMIQLKISYVPFCRLFRFATQADLVLMAIGLICSVIMGAVIPIFAYLTGDMVDSFKSLDDLYEQTKKILYYYIFVGTIALVVGTVMYTFWMIAGQRQAVRCRRQYFQSLLRQEIAWFDMQNQATITTTFELDSMAFQMAVGQKISILMMVLSMLVVGVGISFYLGWILTLIIIAYLPIVLLTWTNHNDVKSSTAKEEDDIYRESDSKLQESLGAITLVKQMNAESYEVSIQAAILKKIKKIYLNIIARYVCASSLAILTFYLGLALTFWYGSECVFNTEKCPQRISTQPYTPGNIVKIFYSLFLPALSINQLSPCLEKIREGKAAAARIFSIIDREPHIKSSINGLKPQTFTGIIEFRHVTFAYPKDKTKTVLKNLSMKLDCRHSAIVGKSGSGKSTIFQLIMRYYDPDQGSIFLDEVNLRDLDLEWLRNQIGYVTQQPVLFASSIRENLLLGKSDASEQQMRDALRKAQALDFVNQFENKLWTYVGNGGSLLSGGQKQRIAIARALLKKPKLLLLDEATSSLDNHSEGQILNTLKYVRQEYITISIANRKRVLRYCNKIYQIDNHSVKKVIRNDTQRRFKRAVSLKNDEEISTSIQLTTSLPTTCLEPPLSVPLSKEYLVQPVAGSIQSADPKLEKVQQEASLLRVFSYALNNKCLVVMAILFPIADALIIPAVGLMFAKIIIAEIKYNIDPEYYKTEVHLYIYIIVGLAFLGTLTNLLSFLTYSLLAQHSVKNIRLEAITKIFNMPVAWFGKEGNHSDKITSRLSRSCKTIYSFIKLFTPHLIYVAVNILGSLFGAIIIDWRIGLTSFGLIPLIIISQAIQLGFIQGLTQSKGKIYGDSSQKINESVMNIRTVLALSSSNTIVRNYNQKIEQIYELISQKCIYSGFMYGISYFFQFISVGLLFFLSAVYVINYNVDIIAVMSALALIIFASITAGNTINFMPDFSEAKLASKNIFSIIDQEDQYQLWAKAGSKQLIVPITGNIEFQNVSFKYENRDALALDKFNMRIKRGESIGIAGPSGCGKSTIFNLILGFYSPTQGKILIEGIDIHDFDLHHLRASIGLVSQEPPLFNETIARNISYNLTSASEEDVIRAAIQANFNPSSEKEVLPQQILNDTSYNIQQSIKAATAFSRNAGPKGSHLSGGQKQRVAIARAILRRPTVLLLDEVTSALDAQNEEKVLKSLHVMMKRMTTVQITHRLETMKHMDTIFFLNKGKLLQSGNCSELLQRQGYFYSMFKE